MDLTLAGLPTGTYNWRSYHHDTENVHTPVLRRPLHRRRCHLHRIFNPNPDPNGDDPEAAEFLYWEMTSSSPGGNPANANTLETRRHEPDPALLSSTVEFSIDTTAATSSSASSPSPATPSRANLGVNGFELTDSTDSDGDNLPDWWEKANFNNSLANSGTDDNDTTSPTRQEFARLTDPNDNDSDDDTSSMATNRLRHLGQRHRNRPNPLSDGHRRRRP